MTRRLLALATLLVPACGGPILSAEVSDARVTSTSVTLAGTGEPGVTALGSLTVDLGALGKSLGRGVTTELTLKQATITWSDPKARPDFSGVTKATFSVIPRPPSGEPPTVVATYTRNAGVPNPVALVVAGDPTLNLFDLLEDGVLELRLDALGMLPRTAWAQTATIVSELNVKIEFAP